ncbi:alpha/beta hydrolase [Salinibius halmophilus]|uniref:alpha/beta hydrolase n=1 Tax=Salinibius halmophilus TaxID=1853216 RepID=UPI000E66A7D3|nr:alpha/beta hydrolase [Salinibius halmophilus]
MKVLKWVSVALLAAIAGLAGYYFWYTANPYQALPEMREQISNPELRSEGRNYIRYSPEGEPLANLVFIPGGLVEAEAYEYLAASWAEQQIRVTIVKPTRNLAIMSPNQALEHLSGEAPNFLVGHSLGGTVAAMNGQAELGVDGVVLLASYGVSPVDVPVLSIVASNDQILDSVRYQDSQANYTAGFSELTIDGGNHGYFGWYGEQEGDGEARINVWEQQDYVVDAVLDFVLVNQ